MVVMVKLCLLPFIVIGIAVRTVTRLAFAAPLIVLRSPLDVIGDHQVKPSILVEVKPSGAGGPLAFVRNARLGGDVGKRSVAIVVVQDGASIAGYVQVGIAVIIVVADSDTLAIVALTSYACFFRYVGECSIPIVVIKRGRSEEHTSEL